MELISLQQRAELIKGTRDMLKLELRDNYAVDSDTIAAWRSNNFDVVAASYDEWRDEVADLVAAGKTLRRVRVVSEPLSEYQKMSIQFSGSAVNAGEDLRWLPRRLVSVVPLPGNDCFVLDGQIAMFNILDGNDDRAQVQVSRDPDVVRFCRDAFETAWSLATPHREYHPA
jgi:hypothetical protein